MDLRCEDCGDQFPAPVIDGEGPVADVRTLSIIRGTTSRIVAICPTCADKV